MKNNNHKILALKYRPKNFKELIGQDVMVQTITNSIKLKKLQKSLEELGFHTTSLQVLGVYEAHQFRLKGK